MQEVQLSRQRSGRRRLVDCARHRGSQIVGPSAIAGEFLKRRTIAAREVPNFGGSYEGVGR